MEALHRSEKGFTFVEAMITLVIVGILAAIAIPSYTAYLKKADTDTAVQDLQNISLKLTAIASENPDALPEDQASFIAYCCKAGLKYMDEWGHQYVYLRLYNRPSNTNDARKDHNLHPINTFFDLYSMGADGRSAKPLTAGPSQDDIIYANDGAYIGKVSSFPDL